MRKLPLLLVIVVYVALAAWLSFAIPLGEAADEVSHRAYVHELAANGRLPMAGGAASGEMYQPPLYYALLAALAGRLPGGDLAVYANPDAGLAAGSPPNLLLHPRSEAFPFSPAAWTWHVLRLVSVALGVVTVWATSRLARQLFPQHEHIAWGSAAFVAFLPGFLFLSAALNNDNLIVTLSTLALWQMTRLLRLPIRPLPVLVLAGLLGLAVLAKMSGLALWGVAVLVFLWRAREPAQRGRALAAGAACLGLAALISSPWLIHNLRAGVDLLGWARVLESVPRTSPMSADGWRDYAAGLYTSFWGRFGGATHLRLPSAVYAAALVAPLLAAIGLLRAWRDWRTRRPLSFPFAAQALVLLILFDLAIMAAHVRFALALEGADLARHLFPGLAPLAILLVLGVSRLTRRPAAAAAVLSGAMLILAAGASALAARAYAAPDLRPADLPALGQPVQADFAGRIRIVDYALEMAPAGSGHEIAVTVHWQATADPQEVYWLMLRVVGPQGQVVTRAGAPAAGRVTTDRWRAGDLFASRHVVMLPAASSAGVYQVELGLHRMGTWQWLPVQGRDLLPLGRVEIAR